MGAMLLRAVSGGFADVQSLPGPAEEPSVRTAFALFAALTLLLLLFFGGVALLAWSRSHRRGTVRGGGRDDDDDAPDAWEEAGRRAKAFPSRKSDE